MSRAMVGRGDGVRERSPFARAAWSWAAIGGGFGAGVNKSGEREPMREGAKRRRDPPRNDSGSAKRPVRSCTAPDESSCGARRLRRQETRLRRPWRRACGGAWRRVKIDMSSKPPVAANRRSRPQRESTVGLTRRSPAVGGGRAGRRSGAPRSFRRTGPVFGRASAVGVAEDRRPGSSSTARPTVGNAARAGPSAASSRHRSRRRRRPGLSGPALV